MMEGVVSVPGVAEERFWVFVAEVWREEQEVDAHNARAGSSLFFSALAAFGTLLSLSRRLFPRSSGRQRPRSVSCPSLLPQDGLSVPRREKTVTEKLKGARTLCACSAAAGCAPCGVNGAGAHEVRLGSALH